MPLLNIYIMKIVLEGDEKKIKQLIKELTHRCKRDKVELKVEEKKPIKPKSKKESK